MKKKLSISINEEKIKELEKRINTPNYSESLAENRNTKPDIGKLKKLAKEGIVKRVGGYSGHHIYQPMSA